MKFPKIVYKYRDWSKPNHQKVLLNNELYLSSPKEFNDPFDCRISPDFTLFTPEEEKEYINDMAISGFAESERQGKYFPDVIKDFEKRFADKKNFQKQADSLVFDSQDIFYGIFSCSRRWDNILMWSHYSNFHKGFCVGFSVKNLLDSLIFGKIGKVEYTMNYPEIKPRIAKKDDQLMSNLFTQTYTKAYDWKYEKEYRFMLNTYPKEFTSKNRIVIVPDNFFSEVILGISIPKADKIQILDICKKKGIPVFQAQKEIKRFKISREEIKN